MQNRLNQPAFDAWLADQATESHKLIRELRSVIIDSGYDFEEGIKWGTPGYWLPEVSRRNIVYLAPHNEYVRLGFFNGATMPDPDGLMQGTGKKLRHIKVHKLSPELRNTLVSYVKAAAALAISDPNSLSG